MFYSDKLQPTGLYYINP